MRQAKRGSSEEMMSKLVVWIVGTCKSLSGFVVDIIIGEEERERKQRIGTWRTELKDVMCCCYY